MKISKRTSRWEHHNKSCWKPKWILIFILVGLFVIMAIGAGTGIIVALTRNDCNEHKDCYKNNLCLEDSCVNGKCVHKPIDECCQVDEDCGSSVCYNAFCDTNRNVCVLSSPNNGTACNDYNDCTINDMCVGFKCEGKHLTCDTGSICSTGQCEQGKGCIMSAAPDGTVCSDNNKCTVGDECFHGMCASGLQKDCTHFDSVCSRGVCDTNTGECVRVPLNEREPCDDNIQCTINDQCHEGVCRGEVDHCYDNNPCTINKCIEGIGCMLKHEDFNKTCTRTCGVNYACPLGFVCADGTCVDMQYVDANIRFLDYEIEQCDVGHRLVMDYVLDSEMYEIANDTRYVIPRSLNDIVAMETQPLGFIDLKRNLQTVMVTSTTSRSAFTLTTACQNVNQLNCDSIFSMRTYEFYVKLHHCMSISPFEQNCLDDGITVKASIALSISDCTTFTQTQHIEPYGIGVFYAFQKKYTGISEDPLFAVLENFFVGYESPVYDNPNFRTRTTNFRICRPDVHHRLANCVSGKDTSCTITGCFNWDPADSPIEEYYDVVVDSSITAIAKSEWELISCYNEDDYNAPTSQICSESKCPNTLNGLNVPWVAPMDDGFLMNTKTIKSSTGVKEWTFDLQFKLHLCNNSALRSTGENYHTIVSIVI